MTPWAITVNRRAFTFVFPAMTLVHPSSCSIKFFVAPLSAVISISPLSSFQAASTLLALVERTALIDSTNRPLV
jgi:hypothetical protein